MEITNLTCTFSVNCAVSFNTLKNKIYNCEFKRNFCVWRIRKPRATALLFESGSVTMSGITSYSQAKCAARIFTRKLQRAGYEQAALKSFKVQNVVTYMKVQHKLKLEKLSSVTDHRVMYEPELSNAALMLGEGSKRLRFFQSGSIISTGYKSVEEAKADEPFICLLAKSILWPTANI